jgi:hypothetical protein
MKNYRFAFYTTNKTRTKIWGNFLAQGAKVHGDIVDLVSKKALPLPTDYDGGGSIGLNSSTSNLMQFNLEAGKHFLFLDKGYFGRGIYWRIAVDAWQPLAYFQRFMRAPDRLNQLNKLSDGDQIEIKPFQEVSANAPIVLAGACQNYSNFFGLGNVNSYHLRILQQLRECTSRPLIYRPNPSWYRQHNEEFEPIHELVKDTTLSTGGLFMSVLKDCHLLVTHGTSAAVSALLNGTPSMVLGEGVARSMSMGPIWGDIETPYWPLDKERKQFFADLAYCQWTMGEFRSGEAWEEIRLILSALEGSAHDPVLDDLLNQYRIMHKSPKYFRGISTVNSRYEIGQLIIKTNSISLLDYGSGKGDQYKDPHNLQKSWRLPVTCYDPGVPRFSVLPKGKFDGVICCDVMEHVPEHAVEDTLKAIFSFAKKFVFFVITTVPAKKTLPDGRNCHVTIKPESWWQERMSPYCRKGLRVWLTTKGGDDDE